MIFNSGWSRADIESLTYRELFEYAELFYKQQTEKMFDFFKAFCVYNCESSAVAMNGKKNDFNRYLRDVRERTIHLNEDVDLDDQFKEVGLGKE